MGIHTGKIERKFEMNIQIFGTKKCNDTKKAERFFKERVVLCQDLAQNKMRSFATKLLTENRPSHTFFQSR